MIHQLYLWCIHFYTYLQNNTDDNNDNNDSY